MKNKSIIFDSNIWIYFLNEHSELHELAIKTISEYLSNDNIIYITSQIMREVLVILTKKSKTKLLGKPLSIQTAIKQIEYILKFVPVLFETEESNKKLRNLINKYNITGLKIHDANIIAIAETNKIYGILTNNPKDFNYSRKVKIIRFK